MEQNSQFLEQIPLDRYIYADPAIHDFMHPYFEDLTAGPKDLAVEVINVSVGRLHDRPSKSPMAMRFHTDYRDESKARQLVERYPQIQEIVAECRQSGNYDNFWRLAVLYRSAAPSEGSIANFEPSQIAALKKAVERAWKAPYKTNCHALLHDIVIHLPVEQLYGNQISIVQSSGTGKSRMVHEMAQLIFTLPFNVRSASEAAGFAYPPPDSNIRAFFDSWGGSEEEGIKSALYAFFRALFDAVREQVQSLGFGDDPEKWRDWLEKDKNRYELYQRVISDAREKDKEELDVPRDKPDAVATKKIHSMRAALESLLLELKPTSRIVIYFDEAHGLIEKGRKKTLYNILCSAVADLQNMRVVFIFLSTNTGLHDLAPASHFSRSMRVEQSLNVKLNAPITEVPFDCSPKFPLKVEGLRLSNVVELEFMAQFGRPLHWSSINSLEDKNLIKNTLIPTTMAKLLGTLYLNEIRIASETAVLDVLINLSYEPQRMSAQKQAEELVQSHMRMVYSVADERTYFHSGYPSEPIIAEAASVAMYHFERQDPRSMLRILKRQVTSDLLDIGMVGELVCRQLLTAAYRQAIISQREGQSGDPFYSGGCSLKSFIRHLFQPNLAGMILNSFPENISAGAKSFEETFSKAIVRFTHFGLMADDSGTTTRMLFVAFIRGMALCGWRSQKAVDIIIPVLIDPDEPIEEKNMTAILVQVKNTKKAAGRATYNIDHKSLFLFPDADQSERSYIALVMEVGIQTVPKNVPPQPVVGEAAKLAKKKNPAKKKDPATPQPKRRRTASKPLEGSSSISKLELIDPPTRGHLGETHPRFTILAYGCSSTLYRVIRPEDKGDYNEILGKEDFFTHHPRADNSEALAALRRLKPVWNQNINCYEWLPGSADIPTLAQTGGEELTEKTVLFVGPYDHGTSAGTSAVEGDEVGDQDQDQVMDDGNMGEDAGGSGDVQMASITA